MCKRFEWKKPEYIAVLSAFFAGLAVHMFGLVNVLHNYDDVSMQPAGYGTGIASGRWFLTVLGDFIARYFGNYNLPWVNGVLFIILIAVATGVIVSVFETKSKKIAAAVAIVFITFPTAVSTLLFRYTAVYDAFALLLVVSAVWFAEKFKFGLLPAVLCIALSLGIYQAYIPLAISLFVLVLLKKVLQEDVKLWLVVRRGLYDCVIIVLGLLLYLFLLDICLDHYGVSLSNYQGIGAMGQISMRQIPSLVMRAIKSFCLLPFEDYCSLAQTTLLKCAYLGVYVVTFLVIAFITIVNKKKPVQIVLILLLCAVFPLAVNFIVVMCPNSWIYTLMVYAFAIVPCVPIILLDIPLSVDGIWERTRKVLAWAAALAVSAIIICNAYMANVNYTALYNANRKAENYLNSLVVQVRMTEGFDTEKRWAVIGVMDDPIFGDFWVNVPLYGGNSNGKDLINSYSWKAWIGGYMGCYPPWASEEELAQLQTTEEVQEMPCWPDDGSIKVIGETVVIKFQDVQ